ncbi:hypothetical protein BGW39_003994, partial [Mortierella sp. 14UC]
MATHILWIRLPLNTHRKEVWTADFVIPFKQNITFEIMFCLNSVGTAFSYGLKRRTREGESKAKCGAQLIVRSVHLRQPFEKTYSEINRRFEDITV